MNRRPALSKFQTIAAQELADLETLPLRGPTLMSEWVAASLLQKAIRRNRLDAARQAGRNLLNENRERLFRRLQAIAYEDVGLADIHTVAVAVVSGCLASKKIRRDLGGDVAVTDYLIRKLVAARKSRAADDLLMSMETWPELSADRARFATMGDTRLREIVLGCPSLDRRALALWFLIGTRRCPSPHLPSRSGNVDLAFSTLADLGVSPSLIEITREGFTKTSAMLSPFVALLSLENGVTGNPVANDPTPVETSVRGVPSWAFDTYTRPGRTALRRLLKADAGLSEWADAHLPRNGRVSVMGELLFRVEGQCLANRVDGTLAHRLRCRWNNECLAVSVEALDLDEQSTRALIDQQLRDRGWEADTQELTFAQGVRPVRNRNLAIAEWPTETGPADYALFAGEQCVGVIEAKRYRKNVSAAIDQAERYATGIALEESETIWDEAYRVPFIFATNGRPYLKQLETESGIWFRDVRQSKNHRRALMGWFTPDELVSQLEVDKEAAQEALKDRAFDFGFQLRPYQKDAILAVEDTLTTEKRNMLVAMATGTGKTKLAIAMLYRLLSTKRFRRICFVVDRSALGTQSKDEFMSTAIEGPKTSGQLFGLKGLEDVIPDAETRVHICTIQGLVKRVLYNSEPSDVPPIGQYDLIVVDECHRGYLLDREMSDAELSFRGQDDYISKYRRVLEYFDAVKIGLTATPALHTAQIFGDPIYTYTYREAVVDGWLIDHEPPIRFQTALSAAGITFQAGEEMEMLDNRTGEIEDVVAPDELSFEVEGFNRKVITQPFNRVVAEELAQHIDPTLEGKTLIFAATDAHADIVVNELKKAFAAQYGEIEDAAIRKITGSVDKVGKLIRSFRNDAFPQIAVTVDLLTTGIDVPKITNLVFIRRVNSRILYEQMLGRATRRCDEIGKEVFRIFDAVDLYASLQNLTEMKPVASNPSLTFEQLFDELATVDKDDQRELVRDQILAKLNRKLRRLPSKVAEAVQELTGESAEALRDRLRSHSPEQAAEIAKKFRNVGKILDWSPDGGGPILIPISHHEDEIKAVTTGYGAHTKPEDFLDTFASFVKNNQNKIAALTVVVQRPRELTREQLRSLRLELDKMGFSETSIRRAWNDASNQDIAASIIGYVRQAAIGDPLIPFEVRVQNATQQILANGKWTDPQKTWLRRIADQIAKEIVVDRDAIDQGTFAAQGGSTRLNKVFGGRLETILSDFNEELWKTSA